MERNSPLVNATWLLENIDRPDLIILDASLKQPVKTDVIFSDEVIPNALLFNWDDFSDLSNPLPHTMPGSNQFTAAARELGINTTSLVVVYDRAGIYSSPRVWWMFRAMGFQNCYVLDGGLPEWLKMGYRCVNDYAEPKRGGNFTGEYNSSLISSREEVLAASIGRDRIIVDARSSDRFNGKVAEPRSGLQLGHIPNSLNIPFETLLFENKIRPKEELAKIFSEIDNKNTPLIFSCGSGVTACIDAMAATVLGYQAISIYDGSWSEWGQT